ncbi:adenosylhomocysteinase [Microbacterium halotolerans]|uniref:adenosylhomocysteinase n=1 Tax=Microbacterium halotolerans TaxID=246613 RepID=UPI001968CEEA|nr:adenosylhomocysteinase [Microbacterium halotolerans]
MTDPWASAERLIRGFARDTNLLVAGRGARVTGDGPVVEALRAQLTALGARLVDRDGTLTAPSVEFDLRAGGARVLVDGTDVPDRGDASGRIGFAGSHMPVSRRIADGLAASGIVRDLRIGVAMVLEPKTAQLALMLRDAGADVAVYAHPDETDPDVAMALRSRGIVVDADETLSGAAERGAALAFLRRGFDALLDDGSHLIRLAHEAAPDEVASWIGANEETTSGLTPLRAMERAGELRTAVIAVNDAQMKTRFDNRYGTGQSCVFAIADLLDEAGISLRDQPATVIGYGPVGQGVAGHLRALGAEVRVAELDPVRALRAAHDGYETGRAADLGRGALVVSATGAAGTIAGELLEGAAVVAVAGGVPGEVDLAGADLEPVVLEGAAVPHIDRLRPSGALVLDRGGCINITAAEGNPIEIMDWSFAVQLAGLEHLVRTRPDIGVHSFPEEADAAVARAALAARGTTVDRRTADDGTASEAEWRSPRFRDATEEPS